MSAADREPATERLSVEDTTVGNVLTRTGGYLAGITSHSLNPYRGCPFGRSLCGAGCYVRHNPWITKGRPWGSFLEARTNTAASYLEHAAAERRWARRAARDGRFSIFLSSSTEPFPPQEGRFGVTAALLEAMADEPPYLVVVQTHSHQVAAHVDRLRALAEVTKVRCHVSIETDRERLPGLPRHGSPIDARFAAARALRDQGLETVITVAPLLPLADPDAFFRRVADCADAVVLDHFVGGDGSANGARTRRTALPAAMEQVEPGSTDLAYRDRMVEIARRHVGRVGVGGDGFAGRWLG